uniref:Uncharacterized protein n=1 Tax=Anguilla anguilla TaxID=7936 RepID=A0A0E9TH18_ANGAN
MHRKQLKVSVLRCIPSGQVRSCTVQ